MLVGDATGFPVGEGEATGVIEGLPVEATGLAVGWYDGGATGAYTGAYTGAWVGFLGLNYASVG
jgi:hypothetical protein